MKLFFVTGLRAGEELEFALPEITVGRELDNTVNIPVEGVSRHHGRFRRDADGRWFVEDSGSTNGIKCNRVRISGPRELREGDLVEFGNQMIRVTDLAAAPKRIDLSGLSEPDADARPEPAPPEKEAFPAAPTIPLQPTPDRTPPPADDAPKFSVGDISEALKNGKMHLFGGKPGAAPTPGDASGNGSGGKRKTLFSNRLYYTLIGCMVVMGVSWFYAIDHRPSRPAAAPDRQEQWSRRFLLYYEKNIVSADNVFYFVLHIENGTAKFQIDDLKSSRSFVRDGIPFTADAYDTFHQALEQNGFFAGRSPAAAPPSGREQDFRRMVVCDRGRLHEIVVRNNMRPRAFENLERVINIFAENYALRTVSMTPEELLEQATLDFDKAEELFHNREARPANLRSAIDRYRLTVEYLDAFVPRPKLWDRARKQLERAERIRKDRIAALNGERVRLAQLHEFAAIRPILEEVMALSSPDSPEFNAARKKLIDIDSYLRKHGGRK